MQTEIYKIIKNAILMIFVIIVQRNLCNFRPNFVGRIPVLPLGINRGILA